MAAQVGIRKVLAEQSHEGAIIYLAEKVEALEKALEELKSPAPLPVLDTPKEEEV